jgi:hypothetical protein
MFHAVRIETVILSDFTMFDKSFLFFFRRLSVLFGGLRWEKLFHRDVPKSPSVTEKCKNQKQEAGMMFHAVRIETVIKIFETSLYSIKLFRFFFR